MDKIIAHKSILTRIGNTPLVKLNRIPGKDCASIYAKCDFLNPSGSNKDRIANYIIEQAELSGKLKPGGTIIESTAGNTGLGLAMVAAVKGYKCICTMPDKMSLEKINMIKSFGAEVVITPTNVEYGDPDHYIETAKRIQKETPNSYYVNQFQNTWNRDAHYNSTGPEVWNDTQGEIDAVVVAMGSGGTISGIGRYLKEKGSKAKMIGVDPYGSIHYYKFYNLEAPEPFSYYIEGMGEEMECAAMDMSVIDEIRQVNDSDSFDMARRILREEGLFCGGTSGAVLSIALKVAKELGPDKNIVIMLADQGSRYISKYLSDEWMINYGFLSNEKNKMSISELIDMNKRELFTCCNEDKLSEVIKKMKKFGVSQLPVVDNNFHPISMIHEIDILRSLRASLANEDKKVKEVASAIRSIVKHNVSVSELFKVFQNNEVAVVVEKEKLIGIVSPIDIIEFMASSPKS